MKPAPPSPLGTAPATQANFEKGAPLPDSTAAAQINQRYQDAVKAAQEVLRPGAVPVAIPSANAQLSAVKLGMTTGQVVSIKGIPKNIVTLESKQIYVYETGRITFTDGKVSDIE